MSYAADSNILLRVVQDSHPMHLETVRAVSKLLGQGEIIHVLPQNLYEFWVVATRAVSFNGLGMSPQNAKRELNGIRSLFAFLPDTPAISPEWESLVVQHVVSGRTAHDVRIVAAMKVHGISHLLTYNKDDFRYFPEITVLAPFEVI